MGLRVRALRLAAERVADELLDSAGQRDVSAQSYNVMAPTVTAGTNTTRSVCVCIRVRLGKARERDDALDKLAVVELRLLDRPVGELPTAAQSQYVGDSYASAMIAVVNIGMVNTDSCSAHPIQRGADKCAANT